MRFGFPTGDFAHCHRICPSSHNRGLDFITCRTRCVDAETSAPATGRIAVADTKTYYYFGTIFKKVPRKLNFGGVDRFPETDATAQTPPTPQVTGFSRFRQNPMAAYIVFPPSPPHTTSSLLRCCSPQVRSFSQFRNGVKVLVRASRIDRV
jgi:hypothetical protein